MKKAVIVGASSGIGRSPAKTLAFHGYTVGLAGRRLQLLAEFQAELATPSFMQALDVAQPAAAMAELRAEVYNLTNTPPLGSPSAVQGAAGFGSITSAGDPRVIQFAIKLSF